LCTNCADWPANNYVERLTLPGGAEVCNECTAKERDDNCL
jgi:hypothetical protein